MLQLWRERVPEEHRNVGENLNFIYVHGGG